MATDNTVTLIGNLTDNPELRFTTNGVAVANFRLAVTPRIRQGDTWTDGETSFFRVNWWRQLAEHVTETLSKGARAIVIGRLRMRSWETDQGERRSIVEIEADEVAPSPKFATATIQLERLFGRHDLPFWERTLWRLLSETAARANELLALDVQVWIWPTGGPGSTARAARWSGCSGRPGRPSCSPACWPAGPTDRSSRVTAGQPARSPAWIWTRPAGGPGCATGGRPNCLACAPGGRCISCAIRPSPTLPRTAPTCRCCWPGPGTPQCAPWSATPGPDPRRSVARHLAETDPARRRP
jgi:single-stranded DNA-binding protein